MRCHYLSDLHLESQDFPWQLPEGDVLIIAGDLCHARCLDPARKDKYSMDQRARVQRFLDAAVSNFAHVIVVAGNHDHYDGVFEETTQLLRRHLPGARVLDNEHVEIYGVRFFGTTLWSDFEGRSIECMNGVRRRMGEYFFVKRRVLHAAGGEQFVKFKPEDAADAFAASWRAVQLSVAAAGGKPTVVVSHHSPSPQGRNPAHAGNGLDGAYASDLEKEISALQHVPFWVHGHTHVQKRYRIGTTEVVTNCRGFDGRDASARGFSTNACFELRR